MGYQIFIADELIGRATNVSCDMMNIVGDFMPEDDFQKVRWLFEKEYNLLKAGQLEERRHVMDGILALGVRLVNDQTGQVITGEPGRLLEGQLAYLHIHEGKVWWRLFIKVHE